MVIFHSFLYVYQRVNLHFPMIFLWFSYGFPVKTLFLKFPIKHPPFPKTPALRHQEALQWRRPRRSSRDIESQSRWRCCGCGSRPRKFTSWYSQLMVIIWLMMVIIWLILMVIYVGKYSIHGAYGYSQW